MKYTRKYILTRIAKQIKIQKKLMVAVGMISLFITAISLISPYLYKMLVDDVMGNGRLYLLWYIIPAMIGAYIIKALLSGINIFYNKKLSNLTTLEVKKELLYKLLSRDISTVGKVNVGKLSDNVETDSGAIHTFLSSHIIGYICALLKSIIYFVLLILINPWLAIISTVFIPISIIIGKIIGNKYNEINKQLFQVKSETKTYLFDTIRKWSEIKANSLEKQLEDDYDSRLDPERQLNYKWMNTYALRDVFYAFKNIFILKVLIYFIGGLFIIAGGISIGGLLMFMSYMASMSDAVDAVIKSNSDFLGQKAAFERLFAIFDEKVSKYEKQCPDKPTFKLSDVDFTYNSSDKCVLSDVNWEFCYGKKYLIVGKSGEGKSTLIKLLLGLNKVTNGIVYVDSCPIDELEPKSLHHKIGTVMQENEFFNLSIRDNLKLICPKATQIDLDNAVELADIKVFIDSLPLRFDTVIGERGIKLSGGQKQRLAIARMILHNPQVIILDEATSALDSITEKVILTNLYTKFEGKTVIIITHRPPTQLYFDEIIKIENKNITHRVVEKC